MGGEAVIDLLYIQMKLTLKKIHNLSFTGYKLYWN